MRTKATIGGLAAIVVVAGGAGAAIAHAQTTSPTPAAASASPTSGATTAAASAAKAKGDKGSEVAKQILGKIADFQHAEWVTKGDSNAYVTHDAIQGQVTAVSATAITVQSADGTSMTFAVNDQTKVHEPKPAKAGKKGATGTATTNGSTQTPTIADIKTGQTVVVGGEKSPDLTAKNILARAA